jgi:hypothetical protein
MRSGQAVSVFDLLPEVVKEMASRKEAVKETGTAAIGLQTGISRLDKQLGGLQEGVHILGAEPGKGKTTFTLQLAAKVGERFPALFISFEESLDRLALKALCQQASLEMKRYADGYGEIEKLQRAVQEFGRRLKAAARAAGYRGSSAQSLCNTGAAVLRRAVANDTGIAQLLLDMAVNNQSESGRLKGLTILSKAMLTRR